MALIGIAPVSDIRMSQEFVTYAQNAEDLMLWRALRHIERGFYIDVGAQDPVADSVTKAFYDHGWQGINIEPVAYWHERLVADRSRDINLQVAASDRAGEMTLFEVEDTGLSTSDPGFAAMYAERGKAVRKVAVQCRTLDDICAEHHIETVHFLKIDCEGCEGQALQGISMRDVRPWVILVEATEPNSTKPTHQRWEHLLTERGYQFIYFDGLNRFYLANEHRELYEKFFMPLDSEHEIWRSQVRRLQEENQRRERALVGTREMVRALEGESHDLSSEIDRLRLDFASVSEKLALVHQAKRTLELDLAERIESIHALEREIERLRRDFASMSEKHALAEQGKRAIEVQLADRIDAMHALEREGERLRHEQDKLIRELRDELARMRASHSWAVTAPLRSARRVFGAFASSAWRGARPLVRPVAHALRPLLRQLSRSTIARRAAVFALGHDSAAARHTRLFLFGTVTRAPGADTPTPVRGDGATRESKPASHSRRQRAVLDAFRNARLHADEGEDESCD